MGLLVVVIAGGVALYALDRGPGTPAPGPPSPRVSTPLPAPPPSGRGPAPGPPAETSGLSLGAAEAMVRASTVRGERYAPTDTIGYDAANPISVIIATARPPDGQVVMLAFFFAGRRLLGNDAFYPSTSVTLGTVGRDDVELRYRLFRAATPTGVALVVFHWDGRRLTPHPSIPAPGLRRSTRPGRV